MNKEFNFSRKYAGLMGVFIIGLMFFAFSGLSYALNVPSWRGYVNDYAAMISPETKTRLEEDLLKLEKSDTTQIYILTIPSLEGEVIEEFAIKVFDAWKAGQKTLDNGIILIVAQRERKIRIEVGRGLEGKLTDLEAGRIINHVMKPKFKAEDYNNGFIAGVLILIHVAKGEFKAEDLNISEDSQPPLIYEILSIIIPRAERVFELIGGCFALMIAIYILSYFIRRRVLLISMIVGSLTLPVVAFFTAWEPEAGNLFTGNALWALLFYMGMGSAIGAAVNSARSSEGTSVISSSGSGSGGSSSSSGSWSGGSSSGSSSGGGGGSSSGGGASGDY